MTKYQKELKETSNQELLGRYENLVVSALRDTERYLFVTQQTSKKMEAVRAEILKRMEG